MEVEDLAINKQGVCVCVCCVFSDFKNPHIPFNTQVTAEQFNTHHRAFNLLNGAINAAFNLPRYNLTRADNLQFDEPH